jgi:hypothetical protein
MNNTVVMLQKKYIYVPENLFSVEVSDAPEELQLELIELNCNSIFRGSFKKKALLFVIQVFRYSAGLRAG